MKVVPLYLYGQFITLMERQAIVQNHPWTLDLVTAMTTAAMIDNYLQTTNVFPTYLRRRDIIDDTSVNINVRNHFYEFKHMGMLTFMVTR